MNSGCHACRLRVHRRHPGVMLAGKETYLFTLKKHGYGYCRSSLEAHLLRQQM